MSSILVFAGWFVLALTVVAIVAGALLRCPHQQELFDRYPNGTPALRCARCLRMRPSILAAPEPAFHRTQSGGAAARPASGYVTGIARRWAELDQPITDEDLFDLVPSHVHLERQPTHSSTK